MRIASLCSTTIAHTIREQAQLHMKALVLAGYAFDGSPIAHLSVDLAESFLVPLDLTTRPLASQEHFTPSFVEMTEEEAGRLDKDTDRDARRKRRTTRKLTRAGAPVLPTLDSEPLRTRRTHFYLPIRCVRMRLPHFITADTIRIPLASPAPVVGWMCQHCGCPFISTPVARRGPLGDKSLCNACGLYFVSHGRGRPLPQNSRVRPVIIQPEHVSVIPSGLSWNEHTSSFSLDVVRIEDSDVPDWMLQKRDELKRNARYSADRFHFVRKDGIVKIQCGDCGGAHSKIYAPGPGLSLANFEVHLRNKGHRKVVNARLEGTPLEGLDSMAPSHLKCSQEEAIPRIVLKRPRTRVIAEDEDEAHQVHVSPLAILSKQHHSNDSSTSLPDRLGSDDHHLGHGSRPRLWRGTSTSSSAEEEDGPPERESSIPAQVNTSLSQHTKSLFSTQSNYSKLEAHTIRPTSTSSSPLTSQFYHRPPSISESSSSDSDY
jgi:hypothetical protein